MRKLLAGLLLAGTVTWSAQAATPSAYDFTFTSIEGEPLPMAKFTGHPVLVVNTASLCGFTYQYAGLQTVWQRYREQGLVVLGVPSNDFGDQEPGQETEIKHFCETNFDIDFPMTTKQPVRGAEAHPFFQHVVATLGAGAAPRWNFHKYLVDGTGKLIGAWPSSVEPTSAEITDAIEAALR